MRPFLSVAYLYQQLFLSLFSPQSSYLILLFYLFGSVLQGQVRGHVQAFARCLAIRVSVSELLTLDETSVAWDVELITRALIVDGSGVEGVLAGSEGGRGGGSCRGLNRVNTGEFQEGLKGEYILRGWR